MGVLIQGAAPQLERGDEVRPALHAGKLAPQEPERRLVGEPRDDAQERSTDQQRGANAPRQGEDEHAVGALAGEDVLEDVLDPERAALGFARRTDVSVATANYLTAA